MLRLADRRLPGNHAFADVLELYEGQGQTTLQLYEMLLCFLDGFDVVPKRFGIVASGSNLLGRPVEVRGVNAEDPCKVRAWHADALHADGHRCLFMGTELFQAGSKSVSHSLDHAGREANIHEFSLNGLSGFGICL